MNIVIRSLTSAACLLLLVCAQAYAESVTWSMGRTIEVQVPISTEATINSRTIVFSGSTAIKEVKTFHEDKDLVLMPSGNTIIARLVNPGFTGNVQVFDDVGDLYILRFTSATASVDETLFIRKPEAPAPAKGSSNSRDAVVANLVSHMLGGRRMHNVTGTAVTTIGSDGKLIPGQVIYQDDSFAFTLVRAWNAGSYRGYQCTIAVTSQRPVAIAFQRLRFPGAIAVHCPEIVTFDPKNPVIDGTPGQVINLYYVAR